MSISKESWKYVFYSIVIIGIGLLGFYLGRATIKKGKTKTEIEYVKGDVIRDTITMTIPYKVVVPPDTVGIIQKCIKDGIYSELFPTKEITKYVEVTKEDTSAIMKDWASKRYYSETLFNIDTLGTCKINTQVQYNRMTVIGYEYTPVTKYITKTEYKTKMFSPFVGVGAILNPWEEIKNPTAVVNVGFYIKESFGIQMQYQHAFQSKNNYIGGTLMYKF